MLVQGARVWLATLAFIAIVAGCPAQPATVTLAVVGDVLLARGVGRQIAKHGPDYPFAATREVISRADIAVFNLECPLSTRGFAHRRRFLFRADPSLATAVHAAGFDVASLANNHTLDYGRVALLDTISAVTQAGMTPVGAGANGAEARSVKIVTRKGLRIGFLAYTDLPTYGVVRRDDEPTIAGVNKDTIPGEVRRAKSRCDVLIVSFHWGVEYMKLPTERQKEIAHLAIDSGADAVIGHHPHVLQDVENYKRRPIIYSAGAFVWDPVRPDTFTSAIYLIDLGKSSARLVRSIPISTLHSQPSVTSLRAAKTR